MTLRAGLATTGPSAPPEVPTDRAGAATAASPLEAYDSAVAWIEEWVRAELDRCGGNWASGVRRAVAATADLLEAEPALARLCACEVPLAGIEGLQRHRALVDRLAPALAAGRGERDAGAAELPADLERSLIGTAILTLGRADRPVALVPELTYYLLTPYLGPAEARRLALED